MWTASSQAELVWEKTEIELRPGLREETAVGHFKYQNKGDKPVAITNVATSCGCTAASTNKKGVAPGEKGEITATFQIGNRVGTQQKAITVTTDDPAQASTTLQLKVEIPQILELQPAFVFWQAGEEPKPKVIMAKAGKDIVLKKLEVTSSSPDFSTKVEKQSKTEFRVLVTPRQTSQAVMATLTFQPNLPQAKGKTFLATARVIPAAGAGATTTATAPHKGAIDACALLTSAEIEAVQGEAVKEAKPSGNLTAASGVSTCYFLLPTASNSINLMVIQKGTGAEAREPKDLWQETFHNEKREEKEEEEGEKKAEPEKVEGVGDEAFWLGNQVGGQLLVLKGTTYIRISVGGAGDQASKIKKSKDLALLVLPRLESAQ